MGMLSLPAAANGDPRQRLPGYASSKAFERFLDRIRNRNAPSHFDLSLLLDFGVPRGATGPLLSSLKWIGVIDDAGTPTSQFALLQTSLEDEFKTNLQSIVKQAYDEAFERLNVEEDSRELIQAYFGRNYSFSLASKMTNFFLYLCERSGIERKSELDGTGEKRARIRTTQAKAQRSPRKTSQQINAPVIRSTTQGEATFNLNPSSQTEFWQEYVRFLESVHAPLTDLGAAKSIIDDRNRLISEAISMLAEVIGGNTIASSQLESEEKPGDGEPADD